MPVPRAAMPTTRVRTAEAILITAGLFECRGLAAKEEAIATVREYRAIAIPPEITAPLKQRSGVGGVGCELDDWVVGFSVGVVIIGSE